MDFNKFFDAIDDAYEQDDDNAVVRFKDGTFVSTNSNGATIVENKQGKGKSVLGNGLIVDFDEILQPPHYGRYFPSANDSLADVAKKFGMSESVVAFNNPNLQSKSFQDGDELQVPLSGEDLDHLDKVITAHKKLKNNLKTAKGTKRRPRSKYWGEFDKPEDETLGEKAGKYAVKKGVKKVARNLIGNPAAMAASFLLGGTDLTNGAENPRQHGIINKELFFGFIRLKRTSSHECP